MKPWILVDLDTEAERDNYSMTPMASSRKSLGLRSLIAGATVVGVMLVAGSFGLPSWTAVALGIGAAFVVRAAI